MKKALPALAALSTALSAIATLSGCATADTQTAQAPREEKVFVTGSNVPRRDRSEVKTMSKEELERAQANSLPSAAISK